LQNKNTKKKNKKQKKNTQKKKQTKTNKQKLDAGVMEAIIKGPAFGDRKLLHAYVLQ
jgi:hypothetical protein